MDKGIRFNLDCCSLPFINVNLSRIECCEALGYLEVFCTYHTKEDHVTLMSYFPKTHR